MSTDSEEARLFSQLPTREVVDMLEEMSALVPGLIGAALVDLHSGRALAVHSSRADFDFAAAGALNCDFLKQLSHGLRALASESTLEDIVLTLSDQYHLFRMLDAGTAFIYVAADRSSSNLALARGVLNQKADSTL